MLPELYLSLHDISTSLFYNDTHLHFHKNGRQMVFSGMQFSRRAAEVVAMHQKKEKEGVRETTRGR